MNTDEPSGIDLYEFKNNNRTVVEPYLLLWYVASGSNKPKVWSMNDVPDVTDPAYASSYKDSNMGFVIEYGG